jgi:hypothetical protein
MRIARPDGDMITSIGVQSLRTRSDLFKKMKLLVIPTQNVTCNLTIRVAILNHVMEQGLTVG